MEVHIVIGVLIILGCVYLAGFFSGSEMGILSINRIRLRHLLEMGNHRAQIIHKLFENMPQLLAIIMVGTNLAIISASCINTFLFEASPYSSEIILIMAILIFGEAVPKAYFRGHATHLVIMLAPAIKCSYNLLLPLTKLFTGITNFIMKISPMGSIEKGRFVSREELKLLIEEGEKEGILEEYAEEMIDSILDLSQTKAKEILTPRIKMVCLEATTPMNVILDTISHSQLSRLPVYDETIDNIIGILYMKDILPFLEKDFTDVSAVDMIRLPKFIPLTKRVDLLLEEFLKENTQIAIVVDEYGGTAGLVTLEDVLEEIVGEIQDEYDDERLLFIPTESEHYEVDAQIPLSKLNEQTCWDFPEERFDTVAGLVLELLGRIPKSGEEVVFEDFKITIVEATKRSILRVKIQKKGRGLIPIS